MDQCQEELSKSCLSFLHRVCVPNFRDLRHRLAVPLHTPLSEFHIVKIYSKVGSEDDIYIIHDFKIS